ncbi:carotenoid biosynthesis protein [Paenibacillus glycanilyticus]|uniref:carotenoid biosynthesis protein n=1 Tax=Paenibacillus glycanilyticus TaxID=126569 RepID=UPI003EB8E191
MPGKQELTTEPLRLLFLGWYACGLLLMLTVGVPDALTFSNGLFLVLYALYALRIEAGLQEKAVIRSVRALGIAAAAFLAEVLGVATGWPFGEYVYTSELGFLVAGVPITMTCAWVGVVTNAVMLAEDSSSRMTRAVKTGLWTVLLDLVLDPVASARGMWIWGDGESGAEAVRNFGAFGSNGYYGIPFVNFVGWFLLSALLSFLYPRRVTSADVSRRSVRLMELMLMMFGLLGIKAGLWISPIVAAGGCLLLEGVLRRDPRRQKPFF